MAKTEKQTSNIDYQKCRKYLEQLQTSRYVAQLQSAEIDPDNERPNFDESIKQLVLLAEKQARRTGDLHVVINYIDAIRETPIGKQIFANTEQERERTPKVEIVRSEVIVPPLPDGILLPKELGQGISKWFDEFTAFSKKWSPRACDIQHKGLALWILSSIALRRIAVEYGGLQYTPLYIALVAPSTVWAKTKTVKTGTDLLKKAGLDWLFGSNQTSPEKLLSSMAGGHVPRNWEHLSYEEKERKRRRFGHSGQLSWYYSEFGQLLQEWGDNKGRNAALKQILLRMDDGESEFSYDTLSRGEEIIENPYIALMATMTPDSIKPYTGLNSPLWGDGTLARIGICSPSANTKKTLDDLKAERLPDEAMIYPPELFIPLRHWNDRLEERECEVVPDENIPGTFRIERSPEFPLTVLTLGKGVKNALDDYGDALAVLAQDLGLKQFESYYGRLRDKTLRVATLIASFEDSETVELSHMAFAQYITEGFRESVHNLDGFLRQNNFASERNKLEDEIHDYIAEQKTYISVRMLTHGKFRNHTAEELNPVIDNLVSSGDLIKHPPLKGGGKYYTIPDEKDRPLPPPPSKKTKAKDEVK